MIAKIQGAKRLLLVTGIWFSTARVTMWLSRDYFVTAERQSCGIATVIVFVVYSLLLVGWLIPLSSALVTLAYAKRT